MTHGEPTTFASATQELSAALTTAILGKPTPSTVFARVHHSAAQETAGKITNLTAVHATAVLNVANTQVICGQPTPFVSAIQTNNAASTWATTLAATQLTVLASPNCNAVLVRPGDKISSVHAIALLTVVKQTATTGA